MCASLRTPSHMVSGAAADGEAPGCLRATRTRSTRGLIRKRSGGSSISASPSMPAATGRSESTSKLGAVHSITAFAVVLSILAGPHGDRWWENALGVAAVVASLAIGLLIVARRTEHPIGWLLLTNGVLLASFGAAAPYAQYAVQERPGALPGPEWAVLWDQAAWPLLFLLLTAIVLVFPAGRLPSARWRRIAVVAATGCAGFVVLGFFDPEPFEAPYERVDRPLPALPEAAGVLWPVATGATQAHIALRGAIAGAGLARRAGAGTHAVDIWASLRCSSVRRLQKTSRIFLRGRRLRVRVKGIL